MNGLQRLIGRIYRPYKFKIQRQEWTILLNALINSLPDDYQELKVQRQKTKFLGTTEGNLFPGFRFLIISYPVNTLQKFKKRGKNYKLSGQRVFSRKLNNYTPVEFLIHDNYLTGLKIEGSSYELEEFDLNRIQNENMKITSVEFPLSEVDLFYEKLDDQLKSKLNPDGIFDIDFNNRTYYAFYDLEDGNYLAVDKKLNVYSLVHDARPMAKKLKYSLAEILDDIASKKFDKDKHIDERYKNSA